jgi:hypothetical protein
MIRDFIPNRAGWWKDTPNGPDLSVLRESSHRSRGHRPLPVILEALERAGALVQTDPGQKYKRTLCPDGLVRQLCYVDPKKLYLPEDEQ